MPAADRRAARPPGSGARAGRAPPPPAGRRRAGRRAGSAAGVIDIILQIALAVIPVILAITLHEAAHGYAALALGDDTARAGRPAVAQPAAPRRPRRHHPAARLPADLPVADPRTACCSCSAGPSRCRSSAWKFRDPRRGMALVASAGPAMNFFLAWLGALLMPLPPAAASGLDPLDVADRAAPVIGCSCSTSSCPTWCWACSTCCRSRRWTAAASPSACCRWNWRARWARLERAGIVLVLLVRVPAAAAAGRVRHRLRPVPRRRWTRSCPGRSTSVASASPATACRRRRCPHV